MQAKEHMMKREIIIGWRFSITAAFVLVGCFGLCAAEVDLSGTWEFGSAGQSWTFSSLGNNRYNAVEKGYGNARGTATVNGNSFRLDFTYSGGSGYFEGTIAPDGMTIQTIRHFDGAGFTFRRLRKSGDSAIKPQETSKPAPGSDMSGKWKFGPKGEYWMLTRLPDGRYRAQEYGFGSASGTATFTGRDFRLDFTFGGGSGYFVGVVDADRRTIKAVRHHDMVDFTFEYLGPIEETPNGDRAASPADKETVGKHPDSLAFPANTGAFATDEFHWKRVDNTNHWGKTYSFRIQGPATLTFRCVIQPFDGLSFFNKVEPVFRHNFADAMEFVKGGESFDGKPLESYSVSASYHLHRKVQIYHAWSTWKLPAGHSFEGKVEVGAPGNDAGAWYQHAADAWFEVVPGDVGGGSPSGPAISSTPVTPGQDTPPARISGTYNLDANNYSGKIEIENSGSQWKVKLWYDVTKNWETMTEVQFDAKTGTLTFVRPWVGKPRFQVYTGKLSGSTITGTFTDVNSPGKSFPWKAIR